MNALSSSTGSGNINVEFLAAAISVSVCKWRSCRDEGSLLNSWAVRARFWAASCSPWAWMILERFALSASRPAARMRHSRALPWVLPHQNFALASDVSPDIMIQALASGDEGAR